MIRLAELSVHPKHFRWEFINEPFNLQGWYEEEYFVYDADYGNDITSFWVIVENTSPPKFYKIIHSWWWENYGKEEATMINEINVIEITKKDLNGRSRSITENLRFLV